MVDLGLMDPKIQRGWSQDSGLDLWDPILTWSATSTDSLKKANLTKHLIVLTHHKTSSWWQGPQLFRTERGPASPPTRFSGSCSPRRTSPRPRFVGGQWCEDFRPGIASFQSKSLSEI